MSGFERLGRELESAAERRPPGSWSRRAGNAGGAVAILAALATVAVVALGAVVLLHGRSAPSTSAPGSSSYTQGAPGAQVAAWTRLLKCPSPHDRGKLSVPEALFGAPKLSNAAPDPRLVARLGVLRGPWTAADEAPAAKCQGFDGFLGQTLDIRYVRYVGPGVNGGQVFLVPGTVQLPPIPPKARPRLGRALPRSLSADVCLITVGGPTPTSTRCTPLSQVERPFPIAFGLPVPPRISLAQARRECAIVSKRLARAKCIAGRRRLLYAVPQSLVNSGVVRDGIVSVDVYAGAGHPTKRILSTRVENNVYAFAATGHATGLLTLVFRDARGRVIPTAPVPTVIGKVVSTSGLVLRAPATAGRATIPLIGPPTPPPHTATATGTIATPAP